LSRVTIFQPCYFAPLYLFQRIVGTEVWVALLGAQYTRRTPQGVATVADSDGKRWKLRVPSRHGRASIEHTEVVDDGWRRRHLRSLAQNYATAPHVDFMLAIAESVLGVPFATLSELNMASMHAVLAYLRDDGLWHGKLLSDAEVLEKDDELRGSTWMLALAQALGAREYLCGGVGIQQYLDVSSFARCGIAVLAQDWTAPRYSPRYLEAPGTMSILDLLAWRGRGFTAYFAE
jgi:hypothetical protein